MMDIKSKLLDEILNCPDVKWKPLGDKNIFKIYYGKGNNIPENNGGEYPVYGCNGVVSYIDIYNCENVSIIGHIGSAGIINRCYGRCYVTYNGTIADIVDKTIISPQFFYYVLTILNLPKYVKGSQPFLSVSDFEKIYIPIPPLPIQQKIVDILDKFTKLTAELTAELTARKQQYEYYRDELLTFGDDVEYKELAKITLPTANIRWKEDNSTYRYIDLSSVSRDNKKIIETIEIDAKTAPSRAQKVVEEGDVIFATTRPTLQRYTLIDDVFANQIASTGYCILRANTEEILPKWIYYNIASTRFNFYVEENQAGSAYPAISDAKVKEFSIPVPPLDEQARIVEILDKFDALTNSITEGLPREIELRQQQYEYYRDLLLSFPKSDGVK